MYRQEMSFIPQFCHDAFHIMIVCEIIQVHAVAQTHVSLTAYGVRNFKIVMIVMSAVQSLMQGIVGYRMQCALIDPAAVFAMYYLAHQPEIFLDAVSEPPQIAHEPLIKHIGSIKPEPVDIEFRYPEANSIEMIISHFRLMHIELRQQVVSSPVVVR